ncbi:unnamed protein product [Ambrosiozyma monospora]|uniref:Unnamed protein product n=1 Tax=Ambrosiozyma monospora TaxID=43982 RepID=A0A9W6T234_AMBMO|nr:unnamed protein product [Ambrosiozyma monospora]
MALHNYIYYKHDDTLVNKIARPHDPRPQASHPDLRSFAKTQHYHHHRALSDPTAMDIDVINNNNNNNNNCNRSTQEDEEMTDADTFPPLPKLDEGTGQEEDELTSLDYTSIFDLYHHGYHRLSIGVNINGLTSGKCPQQIKNNQSQPQSQSQSQNQNQNQNQSYSRSISRPQSQSEEDEDMMSNRNSLKLSKTVTDRSSYGNEPTSLPMEETETH